MTKNPEEFRKTLNEELQRLKDELALASKGVPDDGQEWHVLKNSEDLAAEAVDRGLRHAMTQRTTEQLAEVERALEKLGNGTYGLCDSCGKEIPPERLNAIPQTTMCVDCKSKQTRSAAKTTR